MAIKIEPTVKQEHADLSGAGMPGLGASQSRANKLAFDAVESRTNNGGNPLVLGDYVGSVKNRKL